jgi:transcriptional accessory protein Tex/SPT6
VKVGQKVSVTVISVDLERNRIALSMKKGAKAAAPGFIAGPGAGAGKGASAGAGTGTGAAAGKGAGDRAGAGGAPKEPPRKGGIAPNGMRFS